MKIGDTELASKILESRDAKHAKKLSKQLRCIPDWDDSEIAVNMMTEICIDKFRQVEACYEAMKKAHMDKMELVEAVWKPGSNNIWGTALTKEQTKFTKREGWKGKNQLGVILTKIMHDMFDDWIEEEHSDTEEKTANGLNVQSQEYRDNGSQISDEEHSVDEDYQSPAEVEDGELEEEIQPVTQASNDVDLDSLVTDNAEDVKPEHTPRRSKLRANTRPSVGQVKSRSLSSGSVSRKRANDSPKEGIAKRDKIDPKADSKSVVIAKPKFKPGGKVS